MCEISKTVSAIDAHIRKHAWFDFRIYRFELSDLIVVGSDELSYYHTLEITFHDVYFASSYFQTWHSDCRKEVFFQPTNIKEINIKYGIERGNSIFCLRTEDKPEHVIIAAENISFNNVTKLYHS